MTGRIRSSEGLRWRWRGWWRDGAVEGAMSDALPLKLSVVTVYGRAVGISSPTVLSIANSSCYIQRDKSFCVYRGRTMLRYILINMF